MSVTGSHPYTFNAATHILSVNYIISKLLGLYISMMLYKKQQVSSKSIEYLLRYYMCKCVRISQSFVQVMLTVQVCQNF